MVCAAAEDGGAASSHKGQVLIFFNATATTEIYTLSRHDARPIYRPGPPHRLRRHHHRLRPPQVDGRRPGGAGRGRKDRKSTRLNSSHANISYAVFCLKKKDTTHPPLFL